MISLRPHRTDLVGFSGCACQNSSPGRGCHHRNSRNQVNNGLCGKLRRAKDRKKKPSCHFMAEPIAPRYEWAGRCRFILRVSFLHRLPPSSLIFRIGGTDIPPWVRGCLIMMGLVTFTHLLRLFRHIPPFPP